MAAYAAIVSFMNTVEQIQSNPRSPVSFDKKQIQLLSKKIGFLEEFLNSYSHLGGSSEIEAMERRIASAAHAAEDAIESHIVAQFAGSSSLLDMQKMIEDMDSVMEKVRKMQEESRFHDLPITFSTSADQSTYLTTEKSKMVGCDDELVQLMDKLTGQESRRQIISIVGMGGIGKTMLAKSVYENLLIVQRFDIRLWVTVSQEYSLRDIFLKLLSRQANSPSGVDQETNHQLGERLYKKLIGMRYLIVLDDMWSIEIWKEMQMFLPKNNHGSQIVVTTRESNLATQLGFTCFSKKFLDQESSWNLFCEKAFAEEGCPPEFEAIGKKIVTKCKGLPLSIAVIGGLLRKSTRTQEYWENIGKDINSVLTSGEDERCLNILSLSYRHLPAHLKPCFLYMGVFPEDDEIHISQLIKRWVAEGFLKSKGSQSLEEVAESHLKDLVDRNLILVRGLGLTGKTKTCSIHDIVRDLCIRVAEKEKFIFVMRSHDIPRGIDMGRRIVCHERVENRVFHALQAAAPLARTLLCREEMPLPSSEFRLLRVLNVVYGTPHSPQAHFQQVNLRYLAHSCDWNGPLTLPPRIFNLWNVQTLIIRGISPVIAPSEIWDMTQLRHLVFNFVCLPDPPNLRVDQEHGCCFSLQNLQTLQTVVNFKLSVDVCKRIPYLKKMKMYYGEDFSASKCLANLNLFLTLKSLSLSFFNSRLDRNELLNNLMFPISLKKLSLSHTNLKWEDLTMIGSLPHLEGLKLLSGSISGSEWNPVEGEFLPLKFLKIDDCRDLILWNAYNSHFPVLENLDLRNLHKLDGIPSDIGAIDTLKSIRVNYCSEIVAISAVQILEEQESLGNEDLKVRIRFWGATQLKSFGERIEQELGNFTSNNLQFE